MSSNQKIIYVYDDFSTDVPLLMGCLYVSVIKGGESYSFEYDRKLVENDRSFAIIGSGAYALCR